MGAYLACATILLFSLRASSFIYPSRAKLSANYAVSLFTDPKYEEEVSGCTACVTLIAGNKLYVVRLPTHYDDLSRLELTMHPLCRPTPVILEACWASRDGPNPYPTTTSLSLKVCASIESVLKRGNTDCVPLRFTAEKNRITAAGGFVDFGRVNGNLALSRAIGDFEFKKSAELSPENQIVTAFPDVEVHELTEEDEFLVIACDGE